MPKITVHTLPDYGRRIPVNGEIKNTKFEAMLLNVDKNYAVLVREPSNLPSAFKQADIERTDPPHTYND